MILALIQGAGPLESARSAIPFIGGTVGPLEWVIILVIVIIIFGVGKLPTVGGALGRSIREFRTQARPGDLDKKDEAGEPLKAEGAEAMMQSEAKGDATSADSTSESTKQTNSPKPT